MDLFCEGFQHLRRYFSEQEQLMLMRAVKKVENLGPRFQPTMPRTGKPFSVEMTNAGSLGWVSDKAGGYRYQATHPETEAPWAPMPKMLVKLWKDVAGWPDLPEACLINFYHHGAKMGSHRDSDEEAKEAPVVSVSLGDTARFHVGGLKRGDLKHRIDLESGDVVVLGGASRQAYHGIDKVYATTSDIVPEGGRINLTLRRVAASR